VAPLECNGRICILPSLLQCSYFRLDTTVTRQVSGDTAFSSTGYSSWKCPTSDFRQHAGSPKHQECVAKWAHHLTGIDVNVQLNTQKLKEQQQNQNALRVMMQAVRYLAQQGLSMRGHVDDNGNFIQLLQLLASNNADLQAYLASGSRRKFLSDENQNDILKMMNHAVLRQIIAKVNAVKFFSIIADQGRRSVSDIGGAQSLPSRPVSPPLLSLPSSVLFLPFVPPSPPFLPLPLPSRPLGVRGLCPRKIFFRYTCSHASFSAFLTQKSAVYLTRFPDNNFAFLQ
jgi:hypothetical protein